MGFSIETFQTVNGKRPFDDWLDSIYDRKTRAIILLRLDRLEMGNFGYCEPVGDGVSELKIDFGPGYRIYFGKIGLTCVLLLCGGDKRSQKNDIKKAKEYFNEYKLRGGDND